MSVKFYNYTRLADYIMIAVTASAIAGIIIAYSYRTTPLHATVEDPYKIKCDMLQEENRMLVEKIRVLQDEPFKNHPATNESVTPAPLREEKLPPADPMHPENSEPLPQRNSDYTHPAHEIDS